MYREIPAALCFAGSLTLCGSSQLSLPFFHSTHRERQFDVFLSFSEADIEFAEEVRTRLTTQANQRVFVPSEGEWIMGNLMQCAVHVQFMIC